MRFVERLNLKMKQNKTGIKLCLPPDVGRKYGAPSGRCQGGNGYVYKCNRKLDGVICVLSYDEEELLKMINSEINVGK